MLSRTGECYLEQMNAISNRWMLSVDCWYFKGNSHTICLNVRSIRCISKCRTVYKCTVHSASPRFHMSRSCSHSDVNPALKVKSWRIIALIPCICSTRNLRWTLNKKLRRNVYSGDFYFYLEIFRLLFVEMPGSHVQYIHISLPLIWHLGCVLLLFQKKI